MCVVHRRADGMHMLPDFSCDHNDLALPEHEEQRVQLQPCAYIYICPHVHMTGNINYSKEKEKKGSRNKSWPLILALRANILNSQTREPLENCINVITCTEDISSPLCLHVFTHGQQVSGCRIQKDDRLVSQLDNYRSPKAKRVSSHEGRSSTIRRNKP